MDRKSRTSRSATLEEANEEFNLWKEICTSLVKLEDIQKDADVALTNINKCHLSLNFDEGIAFTVAQRLKEYYHSGINLTTTEIKTIKDIIEKITVLIGLRDASEYVNVFDPKRRKRKVEPDELKVSNPASKSSLPTAGPTKKTKMSTNGIFPPGTSVAARQMQQKGKAEEWILAVVIAYIPDKGRYHVEDVDQEENGAKPRYMLAPRHIIPVPEGSEVHDLAELNTGKDVLALYPGTTCFYRASVIAPPSKNKEVGRQGNYKVQFEDDNDEFKYVMPEHVLEFPKTK
ncbi:SGF29 tudor-like domain-containing protein [Phycomyces blakesleeanus]|uniref:SGF29 tudor-like domain-containing protein n=1 Tax=Phycomyces blakesleeanus TaxID=4837 RepID=A0ABR3AHW0_PHYBL